MVQTSSQGLETPFTILIDQREKLPFSFEGLRADAGQGGVPLQVRTRTVYLPSGDYTVEGLEANIAVERKNLSDLYGTLGSGRRRFAAELLRLSTPPMKFAAVVVEADFWEILTSPPVYSKLAPKTVHRSVIAWQQQFPSIHWWTLRNRRLAEITTFRILERFWKESQRRGLSCQPSSQPSSISLQIRLPRLEAPGPADPPSS